VAVKIEENLSKEFEVFIKGQCSVHIIRTVAGTVLTVVEGQGLQIRQKMIV